MTCFPLQLTCQQDPQAGADVVLTSRGCYLRAAERNYPFAVELPVGKAYQWRIASDN